MKKSELNNVKIRSYSKAHSKVILKRLFELGFEWLDGKKRKHTSAKWIALSNHFGSGVVAIHYSLADEEEHHTITLTDLYEIEDDPEPAEWPQVGDKYWVWHTVGVLTCEHYADQTDLRNKAQACIFKTKEEARADLEFFQLWRNLIAESDGGEWEINYTVLGVDVCAGDWTYSGIFCPKFSTREKAQAVAEKYRDQLERFRDYLKNDRKL